MWLCKCRSNKPKTHNHQTFSWRSKKKKNSFQANCSPARAKVTAAAKRALAAALPSLRSYTSKDSCPRGVKTTSSRPGEKARVKPTITSRGRARQVLLPVPNVPFLPSHLLALSSFPLALPHSVYCPHIHHGPSHSIKVSLLRSRADTLSLSYCFACHRFLCRSDRTLKPLWGCPTAHLSGPHITVISHNLARRTSGAVY